MAFCKTKNAKLYSIAVSNLHKFWNKMNTVPTLDNIYKINIIFWIKYNAIAKRDIITIISPTEARDIISIMTWAMWGLQIFETTWTHQVLLTSSWFRCRVSQMFDLVKRKVLPRIPIQNRTVARIYPRRSVNSWARWCEAPLIEMLQESYEVFYAFFIPLIHLLRTL